jgi:hypothetical protein
LIHGLRGHPYRTWAITSKATASKTTSEPRKQSTVRSALKKILSLATDKEENNRKSPVPDDGQAEVYWPGEFLSADFPDAIIWLYGYESDVAGFFEAKSKNSISQHGQDLFVRLERDIDNEVGLCPCTNEGVLTKLSFHLSLLCIASGASFLKMYASPLLREDMY